MHKKNINKTKNKIAKPNCATNLDSECNEYIKEYKLSRGLLNNLYEDNLKIDLNSSWSSNKSKTNLKRTRDQTFCQEKSLFSKNIHKDIKDNHKLINESVTDVQNKSNENNL